MSEKLPMVENFLKSEKLIETINSISNKNLHYLKIN